jgi:iron complex outermembrane receptor protein
MTHTRNGLTAHPQLIALSLSLVLAAASSLPAIASEQHGFQIVAGDASSAVREFARESGVQIMAAADTLNGRRLSAVTGEHTTEEALQMLLAGSGLTHQYVGENGVVLTPVKDDSTVAEEKTTTSAAPVPQEAPKRGFWDRFRLAQTDQGAAVSDSSGGRQGSEPVPRYEPVPLQEVVVTAEKREERLQDVPMSLTALSGDRLAQSQSYRLEDFVGKVPGLTLIEDGALGSQLVIRGMTSGVNAINSSVATYIDETPYTVEGPFAGSFTAQPNLDTFDMQRIEVLRGPQGTLYGANALGGLLKYVTNRPDAAAFAATAEVGVSSVYNGGVGFDTHSMVNLPLAESAALRLVGYDTYYPGYIDDPFRGLTDVNGSRIVGGRASFVYSPMETISIRLSAFYQDRSWNDYGNEDVATGTLQPVNGPLVTENPAGQPGHAISQLYNVTIDGDVGFAKILSTTSYYNYKPRAVYDYSTLNGFASSILGGPYGMAVEYGEPVQALTQELRLSSSNDAPLEWQVGGFFTNESANEYEGFFPVDLTSHSVLTNFPRNLGAFYIPVHYREYAGFANFDYHLTRAVDVGLGGRYSENGQKFHETATGALGGGADFGNTASQNVFTYSGDLRWRLSLEHMLYARIASGFVPGGPNDAIPGSPLPNTYSSSTTVNYEAGIKSTMLDGRLIAELSAFDIQWRDIQLVAVINSLGTIANGGTAQSDGVEWNFTYLPVKGLSLNFNGAYTDARLTQATPASVGGRVGNRLPAVPLWEGSASADYRRPLPGQYVGFAGADWRFTGNRFSEFTVVGPRQEMSSFNIVDLRIGAETSRWTGTVYVKNVGNKIAVNYVQPELLANGTPAQSATVYMPRTVGFDVTVHF